MADIDPQQLQKFGDALSRRSFRKAFDRDPEAALERIGISVKDVGADVVEVFADLEPAELDVIGRVAQRANRIPELRELADHNGIIIH